MAFVSVTRLRLRAWWFLPLFVPHAVRTLRQCEGAEGFLGGSLLRDRRRTFWTLTLWRDGAAMRGYMAAGPHLRAMPKLMDWCDEGSVAHWEQDGAEPPGWAEAERRMRAQGRPSKVRRPSSDHAALSFAPARLAAATPIRPRNAKEGSP